MTAKLWPVHPQPQDDEVLSSWMIRLAQGNGFKIHSFYADFFGHERQIWTRDVDHHAPDWLIDGLAMRTGVPTMRIISTTLRAFESYVFERLNEAGATRWLTPLSVYHRTRRAYGQQFCPLCLEEDERPYLRRNWRLSFVAVCIRHAVLLQDRCGACRRPLAPHRCDTDQRKSRRGHLGLDRCTYCWGDLGAAPQAVCGDDVELQRDLVQAVVSGFAMVDTSPVYSHLYFSGLRVLMAGLDRMHGTVQKSASFDRAPAIDRLSRLRDAVGLTRRWPNALLERCVATPQPYTLFSRDASEVPCWLHVVLRRHLLRAPAHFTAAEAYAIRAATENTTGMTSASGARRLSGRDVGRFVPTPFIDDDVADGLIASIDREVGEATGVRRWLLLRDKVMFITGRTLHLGTPELLALTVAGCGVEREDGQFSFWEPIDTGVRAAGMLRWYVRYVRHRLCQDDNEPHLFTTQEGRCISQSSVGMRFQRALRVSFHTRSISNWARWTATTV